MTIIRAEPVPNLDEGLTREKLWEFFERHKWPLRSSKLFPTRPPGYMAAERNLAHYACNKAVAMDCRERGDIQSAQLYEGIADRIYQQLPFYAKW